MIKDIYINQKKSIERGLTISEAIVFSYLLSLFDEKDKAWIKIYRDEIIRALPIVTDKDDTVYRILKSLEKKGLIHVDGFTIILDKNGVEWPSTPFATHDRKYPSDATPPDKTPDQINDKLSPQASSMVDLISKSILVSTDHVQEITFKLK